MSDRISNEKVQELTDAIAEKCEELELSPEQIIDGIARTLISAANTFDFDDIEIGIDEVGHCIVKLCDVE